MQKAVILLPNIYCQIESSSVVLLALYCCIVLYPQGDYNTTQQQQPTPLPCNVVIMQQPENARPCLVLSGPTRPVLHSVL